MRPFSNFIRHGKRFLHDEKGNFLAIEWSFLFMVSIVVIMMLLPNIITIGKDLFYSQQIAGYGIQLVAENGQMTNALARELETQFANAGITDYALYGSNSSTIIPYGQPVEVDVVTTVHLFPLPSILSFVPSELKITVNKVDMSTVYVRS
jgi:hypothetical protein